MLELNDIEMYGNLKERDTKNSRRYIGILEDTTCDMNHYLSYIKKSFPEFPDHGVQHSLRIVKYMSEILSIENINNMSDSEIFVFIMSALFHDSGMALYGSKEVEKIREKHHEYAEQVIDDYFENKIKMLENNERFRTVIKFICRGHGLKISELYGDKYFNKRDRINGDRVRYSVLAILLRIGDLMDLENDRVNLFVLSSFSNLFSEQSLNHNLRHRNIKIYDYSEEKICIEVEAENIEQYQIWKKWFEYLKDEILQANTHLKGDNIYFPMPETSICDNNENFEMEEIRFEIDDNGGIWNIISKSIYTDEKDFIRELIQNAIDASLITMYLNLDICLEHKSPRSWQTEKFCSNVYLFFSENNNKLYVVDEGIGMNKEDLRKFLFKVSGSGYTDLEQREFAFPGIAKFGIGFVSCLINAIHIEVLTKKQRDKSGYRALLEERTNVALLQEEVLDIPCGTEIKLELKHKFNYHDIQKYVKNTFLYPTVGITCVNVDQLEELAEFMGKEKKIENRRGRDYKNTFEEINKKRLKILGEINEEQDKYRILSEKAQEILNWIKNNAEYNKKITDRKKFGKFSKKIKEMNLLENKMRLKDYEQFPLKIGEISEKELFLDTELYIQKILDYDRKIQKAIKNYTEEINKYKLEYCEIEKRNIQNEEDNWNYMLVFFDENFEIYDIRVDENEVDLFDKTGILFLRESLQEFDRGVEFESINGLLFSNGKVCNTLARFFKTVQISENEQEQKGIVIGGMGEKKDLIDDLEDLFYGNLEDDSIYEPLGINESGRFEIMEKYEEVYDAIFIRNNNFMSLTEVGINEDTRKVEDEIEEIRCFDYQTEFLASKEKIVDRNTLDSLLANNKSSYYQDGISIPCKIQNLIPVGYFKIKCNCTADARMALNVSRHEPSELRQDVKSWVNEVGYFIQESIVDNILNITKKLDLEIEFGELKKTYIGEDVFSVMSMQQFKRIVREKKHK